MLSVWLAEVSAACLCVHICLSPTSFMVLVVPGNSVWNKDASVSLDKNAKGRNGASYFSMATLLSPA